MLATDIMSGVTPTPQESYQKLIRYLHHLSGQEKVISNQDHTYARPWNRHPDPAIRSRPARFLFMKGFPRHQVRQDVSERGVTDVCRLDPEPYETGENPLVTEINALTPAKTPLSSSYTSSPASTSAGVPSSSSNPLSDNWGLNEKQPPNKSNWSPAMHKLWSKSLRILNADRLARLAAEGKGNEIVLKRNVMEKTASRFRQIFASIAFYDAKLLTWLQQTLHHHIIHVYLIAFHESMQLLRQKVPGLIDRFYQPMRSDTGFRQRMNQADVIQTVLNNHRPKRITGSPLFLIVPNGPQIPHHLTSHRMKHWNNLFGSLGKVITVTVTSKPHAAASDCLTDIRLAVRDKIRECKTTFSEARPLVLVGFGASSLIAAHSALDNAHRVTAAVLLGFPLTGVNGFRGDLDDPLLEITVPTMFVIGQNSSMCTLDDMEDFRERITKTQTALIVVGGCNDRLILSGAKKRTSGITQGMVDRCIADEIFEFVSSVISSSSDSGSSTPTSSTPNYRQLLPPGSHNSSNNNSNSNNHNYHNNSSGGGGGGSSNSYRRPVVKRPAPSFTGSPGFSATGSSSSGSGGGMPGVVKRRR